MLNKIIKELEAKIELNKPTEYCSISNHAVCMGKVSAYKSAISIIKKHESEFEQEIKKAFNDGANIGTTPEDYYNQNYKNE